MVTIPEYAAAMAKDMPEKDFQGHVNRYLSTLRKHTGLLYYHTHRSDRSEPGFPDLFILGPNGIIVSELKRQCVCRDGRARCRYHPTDAQQEWLDGFQNHRKLLARLGLNAEDVPLHATVWQPGHWFDKTLQKQVEAIL